MNGDCRVLSVALISVRTRAAGSMSFGIHRDARKRALEIGRPRTFGLRAKIPATYMSHIWDAEGSIELSGPCLGLCGIIGANV